MRLGNLAVLETLDGKKGKHNGDSSITFIQDTRAAEIVQIGNFGTVLEGKIEEQKISLQHRVNEAAVLIWPDASCRVVFVKGMIPPPLLKQTN